MVQTTILVFRNPGQNHLLALHSIQPEVEEWFRGNAQAMDYIASQVLRNLYRSPLLSTPTSLMCTHHFMSSDTFRATHVSHYQQIINQAKEIPLVEELPPCLKAVADYPMQGKTEGTMIIESYLPNEQELEEMMRVSKVQMNPAQIRGMGVRP
jgi:hypothetical protein